MDQFSLNRYDFTVQEWYKYIEKLMGPNPSTPTMATYVQKLITASKISERWRADKDTLENFKKIGLDKISFYLKRESIDFLIGINKEARANVQKTFVDELRSNFNDPNGDYILEWLDFCHTGRKELLLYPVSLLQCADILLHQIRAFPPNNYISKSSRPI